MRWPRSSCDQSTTYQALHRFMRKATLRTRSHRKTQRVVFTTKPCLFHLGTLFCSHTGGEEGYNPHRHRRKSTKLNQEKPSNSSTHACCASVVPQRMALNLRNALRGRWCCPRHPMHCITPWRHKRSKHTAFKRGASHTMIPMCGVTCRLSWSVHPLYRKVQYTDVTIIDVSAHTKSKPHCNFRKRWRACSIINSILRTGSIRNVYYTQRTTHFQKTDTQFLPP